MNAQDLIGKTTDELKDNLLTLRKEQFALRMQHATGQLTNPSRLREIRRDIARVKTAQNGGLATAATAKPAKAPKAKAASNKPVPQMKTTSTRKPAAKKAGKE
jgi:large subunit ribosomal protein L29